MKMGCICFSNHHLRSMIPDIGTVFPIVHYFYHSLDAFSFTLFNNFIIIITCLLRASIQRLRSPVHLNGVMCWCQIFSHNCQHSQLKYSHIVNSCLNLMEISTSKSLLRKPDAFRANTLAR